MADTAINIDDDDTAARKELPAPNNSEAPSERGGACSLGDPPQAPARPMHRPD